MAQIPIIRPKREGKPEHLFSLTVSHINPPEPPTINFDWDSEWVQEKGLGAVFAQQVFQLVLQTVFAGALVVCGAVGAPQIQPGQQN